MVSVAGGKLTTYRRIALDVLAKLESTLGLHRLDRRPWPLPGAVGIQATELTAGLSPSVRSNLLHLYGSLAAEVLAPAAEDPSLLDPLPRAPRISRLRCSTRRRTSGRGARTMSCGGARS